MKTKLIFMIGLLISSSVAAQRPDQSAACREAMAKLSFLVGDWEGTAIMQGRDGARQVNQTEHITWQLQNQVLTIEGTGRMASGEIGFQAFAVMHFDPADKQYKFRSYVKEGYSTQAYFNVLAPNQFEWGFDVPGGKTRYTINLDQNASTWHETGEYSVDGLTWRKFIELNLKKI